MLTPEDIEYMKKAQEEIYENRTHPIVLSSQEVTGRNPITSEPTIEMVPTHADSVVTEISGLSGSALERTITDGVVIKDGDIWFSVAAKFVDMFNVEKYTEVFYNGADYTIVAADAKGIGERSRVEFLARLDK